MGNQNIGSETHIDKLHEFDQAPKKILSKQVTRIVITTIVILSLVNIYLMQGYSSEGVTQLNGSIASENDIIRAQFITILFSIPVLSFLLGTVVSLIPYQEKKYSQKYLACSLLILLFIQTILFVYSFVDYLWA